MKNYVSHTILEQLGGQSFLRMTGAKNLMVLRQGLQFDLPARSARDGINKVQVNLTPADLYDMTFFRFDSRSLECREVDAAEGIFAEELREAFTQITGLEVRLPVVRPAPVSQPGA